MQGYTTIAAQAAAEHVEKRSRFLSLAAPVSDEHAAALLLDEIRSQHWDASHNCYAYILRAGGIQRYSDDGEPSGTAGMPILEVLRRRGFTDVLVVVTRYFGGTLLGAGGLVRAYTLGATLALDAAEPQTMRPCSVISLALPYHFYGKLTNILPDFGVHTLEEAFAEEIGLVLQIESELLPAFEKELGELTSGSVIPVLLREEFAAIK